MLDLFSSLKKRQPVTRFRTPIAIYQHEKKLSATPLRALTCGCKDNRVQKVAHGCEDRIRRGFSVYLKMMTVLLFMVGNEYN
jgi:hypothetical protein